MANEKKLIARQLHDWEKQETGEKFFAMKCDIPEPVKTAHMCGFAETNIYLTLEQYNAMKAGFKPGTEFLASVNIVGNRVQYLLGEGKLPF